MAHVVFDMASPVYEFSYKLIMYFGFYKITSAHVKLDQRPSYGTLFQPKTGNELRYFRRIRKTAYSMSNNKQERK